MKSVTILLILFNFNFGFCQSEEDYYFERELERIANETNTYRINFEKMLRDTSTLNFEIFGSPTNNKIFYYEQLLSQFSKYYEGKIAVKIYPNLNKKKKIKAPFLSEKEEAKRQIALELFHPEKYSEYLILRGKYTFQASDPEFFQTVDFQTLLKKLDIDEESLKKSMKSKTVKKKLAKRKKIARKKLKPLTQKFDWYRDNPDSLFNSNHCTFFFQTIHGIPTKIIFENMRNFKIESAKKKFIEHIFDNPILITLNGKEFRFEGLKLRKDLEVIKKGYIINGKNCTKHRFNGITKSGIPFSDIQIWADPLDYKLYPINYELVIKKNNEDFFLKNYHLKDFVKEKIQFEDLNLGDSLEIFTEVEKKGFHQECEDFHEKLFFKCPSGEFREKEKSVYFSFKKRSKLMSVGVRGEADFYDEAGNLIESKTDTEKLPFSTGSVGFEKLKGAKKVCMTVTFLQKNKSTEEWIPIKGNCQKVFKECIEF